MRSPNGHDGPPLIVARRSPLHPAGASRQDAPRRRPDDRYSATPLISAGGSLPSPLVHHAALGLPARLPLTPHELAVALAKVEPAEEIRLDLEHRRAALSFSLPEQAG